MAFLHKWIDAALPPAMNRDLRALLRRPRQFVTPRHLKQREHDHIIHMIHIGKTGGTAVKYALEHGLAKAITTKHSHTTSLRTPDYLINVYDHRVTLLDIPRGEDVVFFLRDPVKRFISGFYSRKRQGQPRYNIPWDRKEADTFRRFKTPNELGEALSAQNAGLRRHAARAMRSLKHSKLSYPFWFISESYLRSRSSDVFFIGFQEQLAQDFELFKARLSLPASLALPEGDIESHRSRDNADTSLTDLGRENLRAWHSADYKIFTWCQQRASQLNATF